MILAIILALCVIGAVGLGRYGVRGIMADMTPEQRRYFKAVWAGAGACALTGVSIVLAAALPGGRLR
jgi:hypothetical protein